MTPLPPTLVASAERNLEFFASEWHGEIPLRIHSGGFDAGGSPEWDSGFVAWLTNEQQRRQGRGNENSVNRYRVTKALRGLRAMAPREYECVYRIIALGDSVEGVRDWLNARAERGGYPERYTLKDATVLIISGINKAASWL